MTWLDLAIMKESILSAILFLPLCGALAILALPKTCSRLTCLIFALLGFVLSLHLPANFIAESSAYQFVEQHAWIPTLGISYGLGVDGISLWLVMLTTFLMPLVILSAWNVEKYPQGFFSLLLVLQCGMLGAFLATDLFLFYVFWEAMLIPMFFLIGIWGGKRRIYATMKFFIYTMAGSLFMLVGVIALFLFYRVKFGVYTGDIRALYQLTLPAKYQILLFAAFALSFAIKVPVFLLHTWLPDAHVEAPTAGSVILAGILLKMGGYGFLRLALPLFPIGLRFFTPLFLALSILGIIYGALLALVQKDIKKLVAYSSVSHLGFVVLGIFVLNIQGLSGGLYQMLNHGLSTGGLFLIVGMLYERCHTREIEKFGGLAKNLPLLSVFFMVMTLSSIGLPGLNGFVGEFLILLGAFRVNPLLALLAGSGIILGAIYMLWMFQRVIFGNLKRENKQLEDLNFREGVIMVALSILIVVMGVYPQPFLRSMDASIQALLRQVGAEKISTPQAHKRLDPFLRNRLVKL